VNERQRDLFLYVWSRRRKPGQMAIALRGAAIGAIGGLVFAAILSSDIAGGGGLQLFAMSIGAFAFIGFVLANRVFASQEAMYQSMLSTGAQVPVQKPVMQGADRWPAIAVGVAVAIIAGFIIVVATMYG
jgi:hypothetical protein